MTCYGEEFADFIFGVGDELTCTGEDGKQYIAKYGFVGAMGVGLSRSRYVIQILSPKRITIEGTWVGGVTTGLTLGRGGSATIFPYIGKWGSVLFMAQADRGFHLKAVLQLGAIRIKRNQQYINRSIVLR